MHMADALVSPAVGGMMWAVSAGLMAWCARAIKALRDDRLIPMMGVLGAFIFTAQMVNFAIPVTGSSGHLGGGLLLAVILGPQAAFLVLASVLTVQALFFADGGLLALGCNIFNLGFAPAFIAYPFLYRPVSGGSRSGVRPWSAALLAAVVGLQLGSLGVVVETSLSGISELPFKTFLLLMQPVHLAIGVVEGVVTAGIVAFVARSRPEMLDGGHTKEAGTRAMLLGFLMLALLCGGLFSRFASARPDGLEWSIGKASGMETLSRSGDRGHVPPAAVQGAAARLADDSGTGNMSGGGQAEAGPRFAPSLAGLAGGVLTLVLILCSGWLLRLRSAGRRSPG